MQPYYKAFINAGHPADSPTYTYIAWIMAQWRAIDVANGVKPGAIHTETQHFEFSKWLKEEYRA